MRRPATLHLGRRKGDAVCLSEQDQVDPRVSDLQRYLGAVVVGRLRQASHSLDVAAVGDAKLADGGLPVVGNIGVASDDKTHAATRHVRDHLYGGVRDLPIVRRGTVPSSRAHEAIADVDSFYGNRVERCGAPIIHPSFSPYAAAHPYWRGRISQTPSYLKAGLDSRPRQRFGYGCEIGARYPHVPPRAPPARAMQRR